MRLCKIVRFGLLSGAMCFALSAPASAAWFLKIDSIPGEVTAGGHSGWIELQSARLPPAPPTARGAACAATSGPGTIAVTKAVDKATPLLAQSAQSRRALGTATIDQTGPQAMQIELENVLVSGVSTSGGAGRPMESLSLNFTKMTMRPAGCSAAGPAPAARGVVTGVQPGQTSIGR